MTLLNVCILFIFLKSEFVNIELFLQKESVSVYRIRFRKIYFQDIETWVCNKVINFSTIKKNLFILIFWTPT